MAHNAINGGDGNTSSFMATDLYSWGDYLQGLLLANMMMPSFQPTAQIPPRMAIGAFLIQRMASLMIFVQRETVDSLARRYDDDSPD